MKAEPTTKIGRGIFTIGKETTRVTQPLDKDGYPDYIAALNKRLSDGVTAKNNAHVLIWKALGPHPDHTTVSDAYFTLLGMERPQECGNYFRSLSKYIEERLGIPENDPRAAELDLESEKARRHPWTSDEHPNVADWLKVNEEPLDLIIQATDRTRYFSPIVTNDKNAVSTSIFAGLMPTLQESRGVAVALAARALLRAGESKLEDAWRHLLACHRLARLVSKGRTFISGLVANAIEAIAGRGDLALIEAEHATPDQLTRWSNELHGLPPMASVADELDVGERMMVLESILFMDRHGLLSLTAGSDRVPNPLAGLIDESDLRGIHWDPAFKSANCWFDRLVAALRLPDRTQRERTLDEIENDLRKWKADFEAQKNATEMLLGNGDAKGKAIGDALIAFMLPSLRLVQAAADRNEQTQLNLSLAFALTRYRAVHRAYPKELRALTPKYLANMPNDIFSDKPLIYKQNENGYLLYSVGPNGIDDGGHWFTDEPPGDDIVVRVPSAK